MSTEKAKDAAALRALDYLHEGMSVGLGTGSTASRFIRYLSTRCKAGFAVRAIATSHRSEQIAREGDIPIADIDQITWLDITIDGADEVDPNKRLIKGGGGALVREKIVAAMSRKVVVIVDDSKYVQSIGCSILPVEVVPFGHAATERQIKAFGLRGSYRKNQNGAPFVTENHNWIFDIAFDDPPLHPEELHHKLLHIPAVVETGFFFNLASTIVIGRPEGTAEIVE